MPELPEVETLCRQLRGVICGAQVQEIQTLDPKLGKIKGLEGESVSGVERLGKALHIRLAGGLSLVIHLRMSGRLLWQQEDQGFTPHTRWAVSLSPGRILLIDPRRFATVALWPGLCNSKGIDPLNGLTPLQLQEMASNRRLPIKSFLLDQSHLAGIGNIYACEILHRAGISPWRKAQDLTRAEWERIVGATREVLERAIACRGTSISDWRDLFGERGEYQRYLQVYAREGEGCKRCKGVIQRRKLNGRGTYYCPACQK